MTIYIDTSEYGKLAFVLSELGKKDKQKSFAVKPRESSEILNDLDKFLKSNKIKDPKNELKKIIVYKGQGSFTGLRIAAAVGQALSMAWNIPIKYLVKKNPAK
jgi:tRNA A37 threonylcarbamoyladenosine modification protein TsaB